MRLGVAAWSWHSPPSGRLRAPGRGPIDPDDHLRQEGSQQLFVVTGAHWVRSLFSLQPSQIDPVAAQRFRVLAYPKDAFEDATVAFENSARRIVYPQRTPEERGAISARAPVPAPETVPVWRSRVRVGMAGSHSRRGPASLRRWRFNRCGRFKRLRYAPSSTSHRTLAGTRSVGAGGCLDHLYDYPTSPA